MKMSKQDCREMFSLADADERIRRGITIDKSKSVDHPEHYNSANIEAIEVIEDWGLDFHCGNVIKYIARHKHKGKSAEDIEKAIWYLQRYLEKINNE